MSGVFRDRDNSFGWISIVLHWATAVIVVAMWLLGKSILWQEGEAVDARRSLHVAVGLGVWLLLVGRIVWRLRMGHPQARGQSVRTHRLARTAHYLLLAAMAVMLISGPLLAWLRTDIAAPSGMAWEVHSSAANVLMVLVLLHIAAAMKHLMFHDDETIARIFVPRRDIVPTRQEQ